MLSTEDVSLFIDRNELSLENLGLDGGDSVGGLCVQSESVSTQVLDEAID